MPWMEELTEELESEQRGWVYSQHYPWGPPQVCALPALIQLKPLHVAAESNAENECLELHACLDAQPRSLEMGHHLCQELLVLKFIQTAQQLHGVGPRGGMLVLDFRFGPQQQFPIPLLRGLGMENILHLSGPLLTQKAE